MKPLFVIGVLFFLLADILAGRANICEDASEELDFYESLMLVSVLLGCLCYFLCFGWWLIGLGVAA